MKQCPVCSNISPLSAIYCNNCGFQFERPQPLSPNMDPDTYVNRLLSQMAGIKLNATLIALFLGWLGIHKFYLKKPVQGVVYLLFCWTGIPGVIAAMEGIRYACLSPEHFALSYNKNRVLEQNR